jgi:hypothetical protein
MVTANPVSGWSGKGVGQMKRVLIIAALVTATSAWGQMASLDDQAKCAKQAEKVFEADKVDFKVNSPEGHISFTSHYNSKLGHCFVEINAVPDGDPISRLAGVTDAFERTVFASYWAVQKTSQNDIILSCVVGETQCHSRTEFNALVLAKYELGDAQ